ncbi:MAG: hypothetical protein DRP09_18450 [Candidatus Thorarchaeota archaeon]|nr:MAG: hypothetical protein DRP09_18450 [Candidatus Thorarchaeota archaeon]
MVAIQQLEKERKKVLDLLHGRGNVVIDLGRTNVPGQMESKEGIVSEGKVQKKTVVKTPQEKLKEYLKSIGQE